MKHTLLLLSLVIVLISCNDANYYGNKAKQLLIQEQYCEAEFYANKAITMEPDSINNYITLMLALDYLKKFKKEINVIDKIIELKESSGKNPFKYYFQRANVYVETKNCTKALEDINFLIDNKDTDFYKEALGDLEEITHNNEVESNIFELYTSKATCLYKLGKYKEALQAINNALIKNHKITDRLHIKGSILISLTQYSEAITVYEQLIKIKPNFAPAYMNLGYIYKKLNKQDKAIKCIEKAIQLDSNLKDTITKLMHN